MKQKQTFAQGAGRVLRGQGCCLLMVRSVLWCVQLMNNRRTTKGQTEDKPRWGQRQSRKKQEQTTTRWWVFVEFVLAWCVEGIRCDIAWYIAVYRDIIAHIKRYHKIRYIEILLYPYPLMNRRTRKRPDGVQAKMRAETKPKKTRADHNEVVGFRWICIFLVFRGDPVWYRMIYRGISWYHIPYHAISQDTINRDIIVSISRFLGADIEMSYPVETFLDTEHYFSPS